MQDKHLPQLDGLRGLAILIVLVGHIISRGVGMGWLKLGEIPPLGVDLFFVLSGFLITGVLLRARGKPKYFTNFYARRALRIAPLYFALLLFIFSVEHYHWRGFSFEGKDLKWWVFAIYIQNLYYKTISNMGPLVIAITWSLAIEEQFYTVWPLMVSKLNIRALSVIASGLILIAPIARFILPKYGWDPYINPLCRLDAMAMGGLVAFWIFKSNPAPKQVKAYSVAVLGFALLAAVATHFLGLSHYLGKSVIALAFTVMLMLALVWEPLIKLLSIAPLRQTGKISYCLYIVHPMIASGVYNTSPSAELKLRIIHSVAIFVLSYIVAILSWNFFEKPILSLKKYFQSSRVQAEIDKLELA